MKPQIRSRFDTNILMQFGKALQIMQKCQPNYLFLSGLIAISRLLRKFALNTAGLAWKCRQS
jgi:hypothetical protein